MGKIMLTSSGFYSDEIKQQFLKLINEPIETMKAVIITTASLQKEHNKFAKKAKNDLEIMKIKHVDFIDIEFENPEKLMNYPIIYISGGNPYFLLHHMKKSGAYSKLRSLYKLDRIIVGVSAGAMILGRDIEIVNYFTPNMNQLELTNLKALGLIDKSVFPHYDKEDLFPDKLGRSIEERIERYERERNKPIIRIRDDEFLIIDSNIE